MTLLRFFPLPFLHRCCVTRVPTHTAFIVINLLVCYRGNQEARRGWREEVSREPRAAQPAAGAGAVARGSGRQGGTAVHPRHPHR